MCTQENKKLFYCVGIAVAAVIALIAILIPVSYPGVEYYEYGFRRSKSTGSVDTNTVYTAGRYLLGPDVEFKVFRSDAHIVELTNVAVFASDKLEVYLDVTFQYFLRKEDLHLLHAQFDLQYQGVMRSSAIDALKGEAPTFATREFITNRQTVEEVMFKAVRERLGGKCCRLNCGTRNNPACEVGCIPRDQCDPSQDKGLFVDVKYFQLGQVEIPLDVYNRFLQALILQEESAREFLLQEAQVVRKNTDALVRGVKNEAQEVSQNATAQAQLLKTVADGNYTATVETARSEGLQILYTDLGITNQSMKASFDYLHSIRTLDNIHLTVDFQQRIVGGLGGGGHS